MTSVFGQQQGSGPSTNRNKKSQMEIHPLNCIGVQ